MNQKAENVAVNAAITEMTISTMEGKKFWESKTFWTNLVAGVAIGIQMKWGFVISPEVQALALTGLNLVLRKITSQPVTW
jgi:hypothetical protein